MSSAKPPITGGIAALRQWSAWVEFEDGRGSLGPMASASFPIPAIKPSVPFSGTRLSDWLRHKAHDRRPLDAGAARRTPARDVSSPCGTSFHWRARIVVGVLQAHRQSPSPCRLQKHAKSQGPLLRRRYPASTLIRPCPTPAMAVAFRNVEAATLATDGSPPITRTTFPTCRAHYPEMLRLHSRYGPPPREVRPSQLPGPPLTVPADVACQCRAIEAATL